MSENKEMSQKPIYLIVTPSFPADNYWRFPFIYDQVSAFKRLYPNIEFIVYSLDAEHATHDYTYQGIHVWGGDNDYFSFPGAGWLPFIPLYFNARKFIKSLKKHHLDFTRVIAVHLHFMGIESVRTFGMKHYFPNARHFLQIHFIEPSNLSNTRIKIALRYLCFRWVFEHMDTVISISNNITKFLTTFPKAVSYTHLQGLQNKQRKLKWLRAISPRHLELLHNGVNTQLFNPVNRQPHNSFTIGCIANFNIIKNQITLLKALLQIRNQLGHWQLRFIGTGPDLETCKDFVKENHLEKNISFEPEVDHTQLPDFYRDLDLFVLPSYGEAFGCVFTEAHACGTPFITCEGQGMDDFIYEEDRPLWLCKPKDPSDLAQKILHFYTHRPQQRLASPIDIDTIIKDFMCRINLPQVNV